MLESLVIFFVKRYNKRSWRVRVMRDIFGRMSVLGYDKLYRQPRDIIISVFNTKCYESVSL